jgi:hypothetical protein
MGSQSPLSFFSFPFDPGNSCFGDEVHFVTGVKESGGGGFVRHMGASPGASPALSSGGTWHLSNGPTGGLGRSAFRHSNIGALRKETVLDE